MSKDNDRRDPSKRHGTKEHQQPKNDDEKSRSNPIKLEDGNKVRNDPDQT